QAGDEHEQAGPAEAEEERRRAIGRREVRRMFDRGGARGPRSRRNGVDEEGDQEHGNGAETDQPEEPDFFGGHGWPSMWTNPARVPVDQRPVCTPTAVPTP